MDDTAPLAKHRPLRKNHVYASWLSPWNSFYKICIADINTPKVISILDFTRFRVKKDGSTAFLDTTVFPPVGVDYSGPTYANPPEYMLKSARVITIKPNTIRQLWRMPHQEFQEFVNSNPQRELTESEKIEVVLALNDFWKDGDENGLYPSHPWWNMVNDPKQTHKLRNQ